MDGSTRAEVAAGCGLAPSAGVTSSCWNIVQSMLI